ncbi:MAG: HNH endonuclease [Oscillospiraceae bacterium]|nr:HNH endonuclease [Oscillospiraceae bacterium]
MAYKFCPRCKKLIPHGLAYCSECKPLAEQALQEKIQYNKAMRQKKYSSRRNSKYTKFYHSKDWKNLSRYKLEQVAWKCEAHLDERCTSVAVEVHHIKPIQTEEGWNLRLDWDNLEAVCTHCHNLRHPEKLKKRTTSGVFDMKKLL